MRSGDGRIAFISDRDVESEGYALNADSSGLMNLTNSPAADQAPSWSP